MKSIFGRLLTLLAIATVALTATAQRVIENPDFEYAKSHSLTIERITVTPQETRVDCYVRSRPGSKVTVAKKTIIRDKATRKEYLPTHAEGATLGKGLRIPAEGFARYTLIYPTIPATVKSVDFIEGDWDIFGLRLDGRKARKPARMANPATLTAKTAHPDEIPPLFTGGKAVIEGRIDGYDKRLGVDVFEMRSFTKATSVETMHAIPIGNDGSFRYEFELDGPSFMWVALGRVYTLPEMYMEPGRKLNVYLDLDRALENQIAGNDSIPCIHFGGSLGQINEEFIRAPQAPLVRTDKYAGSIPPSRAMAVIDSIHASRRAAVDSYIAAHPSLHPITRVLLATDTLAQRAYDHLNFLMYCRRPAGNRKIDPAMAQVDTDYYRDFMPALMATDSTILLYASVQPLLNRLAFCSLPELLGHVNKRVEHRNKYVKNGPNFLISSCNNLDDRTRYINEFLGVTEPPFLWQLTANAALCSFNRQSLDGTEEQGMAVLDSMRCVTHPALREALKKHFKARYAVSPKPLPDNDEGRLMDSIIAPYKGKAILVDFWTTGCGPCRAGIKEWKEFRDKHRNNKEFMFLFITNDVESPQSAYDKFVAENLSNDICLRISISDFNRLRSLFNFAGIPRYVLIMPDGRVADSNFPLKEDELIRRLAELGVVL